MSGLKCPNCENGILKVVDINEELPRNKCNQCEKEYHIYLEDEGYMRFVEVKEDWKT